MFFGAFLGDESEVPKWRQVMRRHADWLGLSAQIDSRRFADGRTFSFGWIGLGANAQVPLVETAKSLALTTGSGLGYPADPESANESWDRLTAAPLTNAIQLRASLESGELTVFVPATTPEQFLLSFDRRGHAFANDQRLLLRWTGLQLDGRAVYGMFQYGKVPSPFSISKTMRRVPPGHTFTLAPRAEQGSFATPMRTLSESPSVTEEGDSETLVRKTLESVLASASGPTALYFSGGVDSTLIAARLRTMGRTDVTLVNYSFGSGDQRADLALEIADHLGMACRQVVYAPADLAAVLGRLGRDYSYPFGGRSAIPTNLMTHAVAASIGPIGAVFEGTGADGAFGLGPRRRVWERVYRMPRPLRSLAGVAYRLAGLWRYEASRANFERGGSVARRSAQMRLDHAAIIAQNPLDGIAYNIPRDVRDELNEAFDAYTWVLGKGLSPEDQFALFDLVAVCGGEFAAKCFDPLRRLGAKAVFPFLEPPMLRLSMSLPWSEKCAGGKAKALLKTMLARSIPSDWVHRPKAHFIPPFGRMLMHESMQSFLRDVVMSSTNPLFEFCDPRVVRELVERAAAGRGISNGAERFLWSLMFTTGWLSQLDLSCSADSDETVSGSVEGDAGPIKAHAGGTGSACGNDVSPRS